MGSQSKRKKGTKDTRNITTDLKRDADQDAMRTALEPSFEGVQYTNIVASNTSFLEVYETLSNETTSLPQRISKTRTYLYNITGPPAQAQLIFHLDSGADDMSNSAGTAPVGGEAFFYDVAAANGYDSTVAFGVRSIRFNTPT